MPNSFYGMLLYSLSLSLDHPRALIWNRPGATLWSFPFLVLYNIC